MNNSNSECDSAWKVSEYGVFSGPYFHVVGLNTEIYSVNFRFQSEYRKIQTREISVFGCFSRSVIENEANIVTWFNKNTYIYLVINLGFFCWMVQFSKNVSSLACREQMFIATQLLNFPRIHLNLSCYCCKWKKLL